MAISGNSVVNVKNSIFHNIIIPTGSFLRAVIYVNAATATGIISDCSFYNNSANIGGLIENKAGILTVSNCNFEDNTISGGNAKGLIYISQTTAQGNSIITGNSFHDNNVAYAIWISAAPTTAEYNAFDLAEGQYAIGNNKQAEVNANYNFYGTNDNPSAFLDNVTTSNWVIMSASASADSVATGDSITITADFSKYTDGTTTGDVTGTMAEVPVKFTNADDTKGRAIVTYTGVAEGDDTVTVTAASVSTTIPITVIGGSAPAGNVIYVKPDGNDENDGLSESTAVKTIAKAVAIVNAAEGDQFTINIANGEYAEGIIDLPTDKSIDFIGQEKGNVIIRSNTTANAAYMFTKTSGASNFLFKNLVLKDFTSGGSSLAIRIGGNGNFNLDIVDCKFENISTKGTVQFYSSGSANIKNTIFKDIKVSSSGGWGAIYLSGSTTGPLTVIDSVIDGVTLGITGEYSYFSAAIYNYASVPTAVLTLNNVNITNVYGVADSVIRSNGIVNINNSNIYGNTILRTGSDTHGYAIIQTAGDNAVISIEKTSIFDNTVYALVQAQRGITNIKSSAFYDNKAVNETIGLKFINATSDYELTQTTTGGDLMTTLTMQWQMLV